jgi:hypothetical protein
MNCGVRNRPILELYFRAQCKNMSDVINVKLSASTPEVSSEKKENYVRTGSLQSEKLEDEFN